MTVVSEATARELIAAIDRLCHAINSGMPTKDPTGAERARRYRDRMKYRAAIGDETLRRVGIVPID